MLRDVRSNVTDGLLGFATATGDGLHIKIGVSPSVTEKPITILGSMGASTIKSKLGLSPLADAVMDAVQGGAARVFCIPVAASTAGTIGEVTKTGDGGGSVTVQGSPNNAYALTVRFTAQGGLNTAAFVYSIDGDNFSDEITVPVTGSYEIEGTGLTIKFTEASSPDQKPSSFLVRDTYTIKTTAPSMTNGDVLGAIEKIKSFSEEFEFVHIVGESTVELWEAVSEAQKELMTVCHKPCFFLMEAAYPADEADGDLSDWALKMEADRKRIKNSDIQVCAAWGRLVRLDGTTQIVNLAGLASGRYAMTKVSVSIGKTKDEDALGFPKTKLLELVPIGYDSTVIELLDVAGYMTFREYDGLDDIFVYHTKMMCKDGSDFRYGIYKDYYSDLSDMEFGEMFSAGISDAVRAFKTSGSGMAQAIQNLGASATTAQVPLEEQLSVLGMLQATMGGAEAGTKYKAFLRSATKGGEALGLKFTDANNQLLSMPEILDILRGKFGETMDAAEKMELQKAFGDTEAVALIDLMYNKVGDLQDNIVNMYGSLGKGVSVTEQMASAIQETEPERFERLKQRIHNVTESIGNSLLPTVNDLMSKGEGVLTKVGSWIEKNQELVKVIMLIVLAVGGFLAVGGTLIALISGVGLVVTKTVGAFKILKGGFALARGALTPLISSVWSFTAALLANPVTWVVIGIVALIAALVLLYNKCEWFRNAVNSVINFFKETLTAVGLVAKSVFKGIGNVIGSVMDAAKATVSEKLSNIKTAYEEHGGGISGVAAAAMEAVKGWYTAGYTFIDNLTGGKLSEIRGKFSTAMSNIVQGISQKFTDARTAFSNGLNNIKNAASGAVTWFFESGKRIVSTFANGIKSAFSSAVEAVKGGLQKIRNLLPFSDAKEGPLSTLTLSGQRTMTTYAHGLTLAGDAPAAAMNKSLQQVQGALDREPEKKIDLGGGKKDKDESSDEGGSGKGKQVIIHKLLVPVDLKKIKDLQQLLALLQEVEDYAAANEDGEPGDDEDAAPAPA